MASVQAEALLKRVKEQLTPDEAADATALPFLSVPTAARYLRGYSNEGKAAKNMLATYRYRRLVRAADLGTAEDTYRTVYSELRKRSMFIGALSDGAASPSPVLILRKRGDAFDKQDFEEYRRAFFFTLDCTAWLADRGLNEEDEVLHQTGQWVIVMDMLGYSSKNSPPLAVSMETMRIFQSHFPERAKRIVVLDAPSAFNVLWRVISPLIDPVTRAKFLFTSRSAGEPALKEQLGEAVWACVNVDLEQGKRQSAKFMVDAGLLKPKPEDLHSEPN